MAFFEAPATRWKALPLEPPFLLERLKLGRYKKAQRTLPTTLVGPIFCLEMPLTFLISENLAWHASSQRPDILIEASR